MTFSWIRGFCLLLVFLQHAITIHSSNTSSHQEEELVSKQGHSVTRTNNITSNATVAQREEAYGLLRGSAASIQHVERIVDMKALDALNGIDPSAPQFVFHPPGHEANILDYPFFAHWSHAECGATVIHDDILLTAGHVS